MAKRNRKSRITVLTPEEIRQRREAAELAQMERAADERRNARNPDHFGINTQALSMQVNMGMEMKTDEKGKPKSVWRSNPFRLLLEKGTISHDEANAAHDMMMIYARSKGLSGAPPELNIGISGSPDGWGAEDARQYNIRLLAQIMDSITPKSAKLAVAFAFAIVEEDRPMAWRGIVERELAVTNTERQSERMVIMCEELCAKIPVCRKVLADWIETKAQNAA